MRTSKHNELLVSVHYLMCDVFVGDNTSEGVRIHLLGIFWRQVEVAGRAMLYGDDVGLRADRAHELPYRCIECVERLRSRVGAYGETVSLRRCSGGRWVGMNERRTLHVDGSKIDSPNSNNALPFSVLWSVDPSIGRETTH